MSGCALLAGCLSGNPSYFPYLLPAGDPAVQTHARPPGPGYFADFDPYACRIVLRPDCCTAPVRGAQVFIATVYDGEGHPRRKRRVEWMIEGPGTIVEVDESGYLPGRGMKVDNKYAFSYTDYFEHCISRGPDEFTIGPGQTWCLVSSAVEGETSVVAYCPAINDWEKNRAYAKVTWVDGALRFPPPVTARAGGEYTLNTTVQGPGDRAAGYRVRYRIVDGPAAALTTGRGGEVSAVREAVAPVGDDGSGRVNITQPLPAAGTNRIAIEVVKPDPDHPGQFTVVSKGETRVTWKTPRLDVGVNAPETLGVNQDVTVTYSVAGSGKTDAGAVTLTARVPDEMVLVRTEPKAAVDGPTLIWTLPAATAGKAQSVTAVFRPVRLGSPELTAEARTGDGVTGRGATPVTITEPKLLLKLDGPATGMAGEALTFRVTVTNAGDGPAARVRVQGRFDEGLEIGSKAAALDETISGLGPGQSKTIPLALTARRNGKYGVHVTAAGGGGLTAVPQSATVEVREAQLALSAHGPARGYVGQEATWQLVARNTGDVPLANAVVKATLPADVTFVKATDGGTVVGRQVVWNLGTLAARQDRTIGLTGLCAKASPRASMSATATATPSGGRPGTARPGPLGRSAETVIEIVGVPALQLSVKDSADPVGVGQRVTYLVRVKNTGSQAARKVAVVADLPEAMRPTRGTGPGAAATITGRRVTFPALDTLAPGAEASFVVEAEALTPGDARFAAEVHSASQTQALRAVEPTRIVNALSRPSEP